MRSVCVGDLQWLLLLYINENHHHNIHLILFVCMIWVRKEGIPKNDPLLLEHPIIHLNLFLTHPFDFFPLDFFIIQLLVH